MTLFEKTADIDTSDDDEAATGQLSEATAHNIMACIQTKAKHLPQALHIAMTAISAAMQVAAQIASSECEDGQGHGQKGINADTLLFISQLAAAAIKDNGDTVKVTASPGTLFRALQNCEKLTGRCIDSALNQGLVRAARDNGGKPETFPPSRYASAASVLH